MFGWWYKKDSNGKYSYSRNWNNAHYFTKYWGTTQYTDFKTFTKNVKKGDFIAQDKNNDGKYDHMGFVTSVTNQLINDEIPVDEEGKCYLVSYYNFTIAQHSREYHLPLTSRDNGWALGGAKHFYHGIVKINKS